MSKKFGKFLLFTTVAGAAAYGAYHYLQMKDKAPSAPADEDADDDFDDFGEDLDEDTDADKERFYVSLNLDKAEAIASEAFHKAKEVIVDSVQQVRDTMKSVTEGQVVAESNFTDLTAINKEKRPDPDAPTADSDAPAADSDAPAADSDANEPVEGVEEVEEVEEFFDDDL